MKLLVSVLLGFATAVYNGDGVCKRKVLYFTKTQKLKRLFIFSAKIVFILIKFKISDQKFPRPLFGAKESCLGPNRVSWGFNGLTGP